MPLRIALGKLNIHGALAHIENDEEDNLDIVESRDCEDLSAAETCREAAKALREAADRFDLLALEPDPFKVTTHDRINSSPRPSTLDSRPKATP